MLIRPETPEDSAAIASLTAAAFADMPHSDGSEPAIIERLRAAGALILSLVAEEDGLILGHVAASPTSVGHTLGWAGIGPISVAPERQGKGIGGALMHMALGRLRGQGLHGVVLVGEPAYYRRFGFAAQDGLTVPSVPPEYVLALPFGPERPSGTIRFHPAFGLPDPA
jgi:putative acetyltransferase